MKPKKLSPLTQVQADVLPYLHPKRGWIYRPILYVDGVLTCIARTKPVSDEAAARKLAEASAASLRKVVAKLPHRATKQSQVALDYLNSVWRADPAVIEHMFGTQFACNAQLGAHPYCVVGTGGVGPLGLINGLLHALGFDNVARQSPVPETDEAPMFVPYKPQPKRRSR